jgi:hypothetical protein
MRKQFLRIVVVLIAVAGLGVAAKGQDVDRIVVNVPYQFVVGGKALPAGTYRVNRLSAAAPRVLMLTGYQNNASAMILATDVENNLSDKPEIALEQFGNEYFLSKVETAGHLYRLPISRAQGLDAAAKSRNGTLSK